MTEHLSAIIEEEQYHCKVILIDTIKIYEATPDSNRHHKVRNILNVKHRITKEPLSLFFIDLEPKENNKCIYDMEFLCNMKITVEAPRPKTHRPMYKMPILWSYKSILYKTIRLR
jgi:hypothetical protein